MPSNARSNASRRTAVAVSAGLLAAVATVALSPLGAQAHTTLVSSSPCDGQVLAAVPATVELTFDQAVGPHALVSVTGPNGTDIAVGDPVVDGARVTQATRLFPAQGKYTARYGVVSADGQTVRGAIHFAVDPTSATASSPAGDSCAGSAVGAASAATLWRRESTWVVVAVAALAVAIAGILAAAVWPRRTAPSGGGR